MKTPLGADDQKAHVLRAVGGVLGGPRSLKFPPGRVLQALCSVAGFQAAVTLRSVEEIMPIVLEGRGLPLGEGVPAPCTFVRDQAGVVNELVLRLLVELAAVSVKCRIGTAEGLGVFASVVGQVSQLVICTEDEIRALLQEGHDRGAVHKTEVQEAFSTYNAEKARRQS